MRRAFGIADHLLMGLVSYGIGIILDACYLKEVLLDHVADLGIS